MLFQSHCKWFYFYEIYSHLNHIILTNFQNIYKHQSYLYVMNISKRNWKQGLILNLNLQSKVLIWVSSKKRRNRTNQGEMNKKAKLLRIKLYLFQSSFLPDRNLRAVCLNQSYSVVSLAVPSLLNQSFIGLRYVINIWLRGERVCKVFLTFLNALTDKSSLLFWAEGLPFIPNLPFWLLWAPQLLGNRLS